MKPEEFRIKLITMQDDLVNFINKTGPRIVGKLAVDYFKNNFRKGSFDGKKWKAPKRFNESGKNASDKYGPLLSPTAELMNSLTYKADIGMVTISSDKVYARIHNEGGTINVPVTDKMKKFAWAKHYQENPENKKADSMWKGIALTKKPSLKITIPQRQFLGSTKEIEDSIQKKIEEHLTKIFK
jgi:phage gpG-like protein